MHFFTFQNFNKKIQGGLVLVVLLVLGVQVVNAQTHRLIITEPAGIAGEYDMIQAAFGPTTCSIEGEASIAIDGAGTAEACDTVTNDMTGKIAFIDRGSCNFSVKVLNAEAKGAIAVIVCNNSADPAIIPMGGGDLGDLVTIPSYMVSQEDCNLIRTEVEGTTVTVDIPADNSGEVIIWEDQFDGGLGDWTSNNISCGGAITDTFQLWRWHPTGSTEGSSCGDNSIDSRSICNGAAVFASDAHDNVPGAGCGDGGGPCPAAQIGELISPPIDLSGSTAAGVSLRFTQLARQFQSLFFVGWSLDGGVTWDSVEINQELIVNAQGDEIQTTVNKIPLVGAVGQPDVRVKFRYEANYYYWMIDDVQIVEQEANNLRVNENFYTTPVNAITPLSQIEPIPFLADIENVGAADQINVVLNMTITDQDNNEVFNADNEYGDVPANTIVENIPFVDDFTPESEGLYRGVYSISAEAADDDPSNNTQEFEFIVSDTVFAKEFGATRNITPGEGNYDDGAPFSYAYGNYFYVPNGAGNFVNTVSFSVAGTPESAGIELAVVLYEWVDTDPEADFPAAEPEERNFVTFGTYIIQGDEDENNIITIPVEDVVELKDDTDYLLMVEYLANERTSVFLGASNTIDYSAAIFTSNLLGTPRYGSMLGVPSDGDLSVEAFSSVGFGRNLVPVVRLNVGIPVNANDVQVLKNEFHLFPNPTSDQINVQLNLEELAQSATVRILDFAGRQVLEHTYDNLQKERLNFNLNNFAAGTYTVQVVTDRGAGSKRFIVK